jgi:hypothetical protein
MWPWINRYLLSAEGCVNHPCHVPHFLPGLRFGWLLRLLAWQGDWHKIVNLERLFLFVGISVDVGQ